MRTDIAHRVAAIRGNIPRIPSVNTFRPDSELRVLHPGDFVPQPLTATSAHPVVWACVKIVSESLGRGIWRGAPRTVMRLNQMGPSAYVAKRSLGEDLMLKGNAFIYRMPDDRLAVVRDMVVHGLPGEMPEYSSSTLSRLLGPRAYTPSRSGQSVLDPARVVHIAGPMFDGIRSPSVLAGAAKMAIALSKNAAAYQSEQLKNGHRGRSVLAMHETLARWGDDQIEETARSINVQQEAARREGFIPILPPGLTPHQLGGVSPADLEIVELMRWTVEDVCRVFGVPPRMIGHYSAALRVRGIEAQAEDFLRWCLEAPAQLMGESITTSYQTAPVWLDMFKIGLGSFSERAATLRNLVGVITVDEARELQGYDPFGDERGEQLLQRNDGSQAGSDGGRPSEPDNDPDRQGE